MTDPYRTTPPTPPRAPKTPAYRLVLAKIRGVMHRLRIRQQRHWLTRHNHRASWKALQDLATVQLWWPSSNPHYLDRCTEIVTYEHFRGFYRPGRKDFRARVSREEHEAWKRERT